MHCFVSYCTWPAVVTHVELLRMVNVSLAVEHTALLPLALDGRARVHDAQHAGCGNHRGREHGQRAEGEVVGQLVERARRLHTAQEQVEAACQHDARRLHGRRRARDACAHAYETFPKTHPHQRTQMGGEMASPESRKL